LLLPPGLVAALPLLLLPLLRLQVWRRRAHPQLLQAFLQALLLQLLPSLRLLLLPELLHLLPLPLQVVPHAHTQPLLLLLLRTQHPHQAPKQLQGPLDLLYFQGV
jgi:hypothetical protein